MPIHDLNSTSAHVRHGFKAGLAALLAYLVTHQMGPHFGQWAAVSAVIVMQFNVADSIQMCWYRFTGTALGALIGILAIYLLPDTPEGTMVALFLSVSFCAYMTRYNARYRMAAITVSIVLLASLGQEGRIAFGLQRVLEIAIGVACAFVVSVLIFPVKAGLALKERLKNQLTQCAETYALFTNEFLSPTPNVDPAILDELGNEMKANRPMLSAIQRHEKMFFDQDTAMLDLQIQLLNKCYEHLQAMLHIIQETNHKGYCLIMEPQLRSLVETTDDVLLTVAKGELPDRAPLSRALYEAEHTLEDVRASGATRRFSLREMVQVLSFYHSVQQLGEDVQAILAQKSKEQFTQKTKQLQ